MLQQAGRPGQRLALLADRLNAKAAAQSQQQVCGPEREAAAVPTLDLNSLG